MTEQGTSRNLGLIRLLTYLMFLMFAMTTDAVGVIIPEVIAEFGLSLTQAGAFHYASMIAIAISGVGLGFLADRLGRKLAILLGLVIFALSSFLFAVGNAFAFFLILLAASGIAIGVFKTAALALIGDVSNSGSQHTRTMNTVEGYFAVGAIIGPAVVTSLLAAGASWKFLYVIAGVICAVLLAIAAFVEYPVMRTSAIQQASFTNSLRMLKNPYAMGFSLAIALYVAAEVAIYVWMPTYLQSYPGNIGWLSAYALTIFFVLRAVGRFLGAWVLARFSWTSVMLVFSAAIFACFAGSVVFGVSAGVFLLPASGLFMSMIYPTLNSKGISCFAKNEHGSVAGVLLFFTAASAALAPLAMGAVGDIFGDVKYGFVLATGFAGALFAAMLFNALKDPAGAIHAIRDRDEYARSA